MRNSDRPQIMALSLLTALAWLCVDLQPAKAFLNEVVAGRVATADEAVSADEVVIAEAVIAEAVIAEAGGAEMPAPLASAKAPQVASIPTARGDESCCPAPAARATHPAVTWSESIQQTDRQIHVIRQVANSVAASFAPTLPLLGASPQQIRDIKQVFEHAGLDPALLRALSTRLHGVHVEHVKRFQRPSGASTTTVRVHFVRS